MSTRHQSRPRPSNTCYPCKRRKLKCDQRRPICGRCETTLGVECSYDYNLQRQELSQLGPSSLENWLPSTNAENNTTDPPAPEYLAISSHRISNLEQRLEALSSLVQSMRPNRPDVLDKDKEQLGQSNTCGETAREVQEEPPPSRYGEPDGGTLAVQPGGRTRYVSRSFWASLCEESSRIEDLLQDQTRYIAAPRHPFPPGASAFSGTLLSSAPIWGLRNDSSSRYRVAKNLDVQIPDRKVCDDLLQAFIWNFHPVIPMVHIPTLREQYAYFWELQDKHLPPPDHTTIPFILAVLFAGAAVVPVRDVREPDKHKELVVSLYQTASEALHSSCFPRTPTVQSLTAYLILQCTFMREEEPLTTCSFIGVAVRVAQMLGLHKDPRQFESQAKIAAVAAEVRRRVWWHVFALDVLVATAAGLPPLIGSNSFDVALPTDLREDLWDTPQGKLYIEAMQPFPESETEHRSALGIFIRSRIELRRSQRKILDQLNFQPRTEHNESMTAMRAELEGLTSHLALRIDLLLNLRPSIDTYETNRTYASWGAVLLHAMVDKNWWFLHPLLCGQSPCSEVSLLPRVKSHMISFLDKFIALSCIEQFSCFQWCWPGNHQPLHPLMVLLREIERDPNAPESISACTLIDQTIALCDLDGGVTGNDDPEQGVWGRALVEGGCEAWSLIRQLRTKTYLKIGRDPDLLPSRNDVVSHACSRLDAIVTMTAMSARSGCLQGLDTMETSPSAATNDLSILAQDGPEYMIALAAEDIVTPNQRFFWNEWNPLFQL